jgi:hypothetical protein
LLFGIAHIKWDEVESEDDDEPVEMCPTTSTTTTEHQTSTLKQEGDKRSEGRVSLEEAVQPPPRGSLTAPNREASTFYGEALVLWPRREARRRSRPRVKRVKRSKIQDLRQENLNFSNPNLPPWLVSMNHWLTNMTMISNISHIEQR